MKYLNLLIAIFLFISCGVDKKEVEEVKTISDSWTRENIIPLYEERENAKIDNDLYSLDEIISDKLYKKIEYNKDSVSSMYWTLMKTSADIEKLNIEYKQKSVSSGASLEKTWYNDQNNERALSMIKSSTDGLSKLDNIKPKYFYILSVTIEYNDPYQNKDAEIFIYPSNSINIILDENKNVLNSKIEAYKDSFNDLDGNKYEFTRYRNIK